MQMIGRGVQAITLQQIAAFLLFLVCLAALGIFAYDEITHHAVDAEVQTILGFITGMITTILGVKQGSGNDVSNTNLSAAKRDSLDNGSASVVRP